MDQGDASLTTRARIDWRLYALFAPAGLFLLVFLAYPLEEMLRVSFTREGGFAPLVESSYYLERAWFSFWQAIVSALATLVLALPVAWLLATRDFRGKGLFEAVIMVPFVLPTIVVAVAFTALLGPNGSANEQLMRLPGVDKPPIHILNTIWVILLAHVFYNVALAARIIATGWRAIDSRLDDAAAMLGLSPPMRFFRVTLPLLRNALLAAGSLVFLFCFTSFGVVLILGGPRFGTLETEIYRETLFLFRLPVAAALALSQMVVTFAAILVNTRLQQSTAQREGRRRASPWSWRTVALSLGIAAAALILTLVPMAALIERSFAGGDGYTLGYYRMLDDNVRGQALFVTPLTAVRNSLTYALATVLVAVPLGTLTAVAAVRARSTLAEALVQFPLGVSAITLGLGFLITFDEPPLDLRASPVLVVIAHSLVATPFVARTVASRLRGLDPALRDAAAMLGAGPFAAFLRVELPLLAGAIGVGAALSFAASMGEFGATLLIARPEYPTIPVAIFRFLGQPGAANFGQALAMSSILMAVTTVAFMLVSRVISNRESSL
jgi:thiamine transport system permease protein